MKYIIIIISTLLMITTINQSQAITMETQQHANACNKPLYKIYKKKGINAIKQYAKKPSNKCYLQALVSIAGDYRNAGNYDQAKKYYILSAKAGNKGAYFNLARLYDTKLKKYNLAKKYYLAIAHAGYKIGYKDLSLMYKNSLHDSAQAQKYLDLSK